MRRRRLFTACSAVSLLLCAAVCVLWVRSYGSFERFAWGFGRTDLQLIHMNGRIGVEARRGVAYPPEWYSERVPASGQSDLNKEPGAGLMIGYEDMRHGRLLGFSFASYRYRDVLNRAEADQRTSVWRVVAPHGVVMVAAGLIPVVVLLRRLQRRSRVGCGRCPACGYDLRATPDRCPECGAVATGVMP